MTADVLQFRNYLKEEKTAKDHYDSLAFFFYLRDLRDELAKVGRYVKDKHYWLPCFMAQMPVAEAVENF